MIKLKKISEFFMTNFKKCNKLVLIELLILIISFALCLFDLVMLPLILLIISSFILIKVVKDMTTSYINIPFLFTCFHILYGLSGVISIAWGGELSSTYGKKFDICPYLIAYSLCTIALILGMYLCNLKNQKYDLNYYKTISDKKIRKYFLLVTICGFLLATSCELINFFRAGGVEVLMAGKAVYQAAVDKLIFTIPTQLICQISLASLGVYIILCHKEKVKISKRALIFIISISVPYFLLLLFLGRRGPILAYLLIILLSISQFKPLKKISFKVILILCISYMSLASLYAVRNYTDLIFTDFTQFTEKVFEKRNITKAFNPGFNEFGCTFGNFNKLYVSNDYKFLYGKSYIQGLFHFVPSYLYPGDKPQMITYQFRDQYFSFKAEISSIASTAFSSILETYWNFGYFGALMYIVYGYILILLDKKIKNKNYFTLLTCLAISPFVYSFHRSDFGHITMEIILLTLCVLVIYCFYYFIYSKDTKIAKIFHKLSEI